MGTLESGKPFGQAEQGFTVQYGWEGFIPPYVIAILTNIYFSHYTAWDRIPFTFRFALLI